MSLTVNDDFQRNGYNLVSCQNPLILNVSLGNTVSSASSGGVTVEITGSGDNTETYEFDMGYVGTTGGPDYIHNFKLNITDIIREICNEPDLENEASVSSEIMRGSRLATAIEIKVSDLWKVNSSVYVENVYMHGFNQVNNPDSSCLVDFADGDEEAVIPIAPGSPMLFWLWQHAAGTSTPGPSGIIVDIGVTARGFIATEQGLYQMHVPIDFNQNLHDDWGSVPKEYTLELSGVDSDAKLTLVALSEACEGSVVLSWLNRYGFYSYMSFAPEATWRNKQKHIGSYGIQVDDLADVKSRTKSRGFSDAKQVISAVAKNVPTQYFEAIEDLFYSMDVYYFTGTLPKYTYDPTEWLRVEVKGDLIDRKKHSHENVRVEITLPEKYTQQR